GGAATRHAGHRSGLQPADHAAAGDGAGARLPDRRRAGHAAAPGGAGLCPLVRARAGGRRRAAPGGAGAMMPFRLGLTGSIGMGKSATAALFRAKGCPVWDADAAVHRLYAPGGALVGPVAALFPDALREGGIDRAALKAALGGDTGR